jgi:hypothetical protein
VVAVDNSLGFSHGAVYVEDPHNNRVERFTPSGEFVLTFGGEVNRTAHEKGETANEDVCPVNPGDQCQAGTPGAGPSRFETLGSNAIAVGPTGTVYVGDNSRVQKFSAGGAPEGEIVLPETGQIEGLAVDSSGDMYVLRSSAEGVRKYDGEGTQLGEARDPGLSSSEAAITVGPGDELFVSDGAKQHVLGYGPSGTQLASVLVPDAEDARGGIAFTNGLAALYVLYTRAHTSVRTLTLPPSGPVILEGSEAATGVLPAVATLNARINPEGPEEAHYRFEYGTSTAYGSSTAEKPLVPGFEDQPASAAASGLQPSTVYHFRARATNALNQTTLGRDETFTTLPPVSIDSTSVSGISATAATLETTINPHGLASTYRFQYGPTTAYGSETPLSSGGAGERDVTRTAQIGGLAPHSTYHFRVLAENSLGAVAGPDLTFTTQGRSPFLLPDGRAWELVSPPDKRGVPLETGRKEGGAIQAASDGFALTYVAAGAAVAEPSGNRSFFFSQLISRRTEAGWATQDISTPHRAPAGALAGPASEYALFSPDLSLSVVEPSGATRLSPLASEKTPYLRRTDGSFTPFVYPGNLPPGTEFGGVETQAEEFTGVDFYVAATPDLAHVLLASPKALTGEFAAGYQPTYSSPNNLYEWAAGILSLVSWVPTSPAVTCGGAGPLCVAASEAGQTADVGSGRYTGQAISTDGSRIVFTTQESGTKLYLRDHTRSETVQLDAPEPGCSSCQGGAGEYRAASADGSRVLFTDQNRLTADSTAKAQRPDLYECHVNIDSEGHLACKLTDLTVNSATPSQAADVQSLLIASADASQLYFVAHGAITGPAVTNEHGEHAEAGQSNLYLSRDGVIRFIARLSAQDKPDWNIAENETTSRASSDGRFFAFMSQRSLTGYDNRDARSGEPDQEVYLYDSQANAGQGRLLCASCNPTGARPNGVFDSGTFPGLLLDRHIDWEGETLAASVPAWTRRAGPTPIYQPRYLSDSGRLFFNSADALLPQDTNGTFDVYQFEFPQGPGQPASNSCTPTLSTYNPTSGGCVSLLSSGTSPEESVFLDASESGNDVFFLSGARLSAKDVDDAYDVYDARVGSGEPAAVKPPSCEGDACQSPVQAPNDPTPGSLTFHGLGNFAPPLGQPAKKTVKCAKAKKLSHAKARKPSHGRCVKAKSKKKRKARARKANKASHSRRTSR